MPDLAAARWLDLPSITDARGVLTAIEGGQDIPFAIARIFYMHHIQADRGGHAHIDTDQVVIAAAGSLVMDLSDGQTRRRFELSNPTRGVYTPRLLFIELHSFSPDAVCLVLASTHYDINRSLRSHQAYLDYLAAHS